MLGVHSDRHIGSLRATGYDFQGEVRLQENLPFDRGD